MVRIARLKTADLDATTADIEEATIGILHCDSLTDQISQVVPQALTAVAPLAIDGRQLLIDDASTNGSGVITTGAQEIAGKKTFTATVACTGYAVASEDLTTKGYVDDRVTQGVKWNYPVLAILDVATIQSPTDGDRYIASVTNGDFLINHVYTFEADSDSWMDRNPEEGTVLYVIGGSQFTDQTIVFNGTAWVSNGNTVQHQSLIGAGTKTHAQIDDALLNIDQPVKQASEPTFAKVKASRVIGSGTIAPSAPRPLTFYASMSTQIKPEFANAPVTYTGALTITNGKLVLSDTAKVTYTGTGFDGGLTGTIRLKYTPAYSGMPASGESVICSASLFGSNRSMVKLTHQSSSRRLYLVCCNNASAIVVANYFATWSATAGQEYEIEICWDLTGATAYFYLYVDGSCVGTLTAATYTRDVGGYLALGTANASLREVRMYSKCMHRGEPYTPLAVDTSALQAFGGAVVYGDDSTSVETGALRVNGGAAVTNALSVGTSATIGGSATVTGALTAGSATITGPTVVPTPTDATHAATKGYVDTTIGGGSVVSSFTDTYFTFAGSIPGSNVQVSGVKYSNGLVQLKIPMAWGNSTSTALIYSTTGLDAAYRPAAPRFIPYPVVVNGETALGCLVVGTDGVMTWRAGAASTATFASGANNGFYAQVVTYATTN